MLSCGEEEVVTPSAGGGGGGGWAGDTDTDTHTTIKMQTSHLISLPQQRQLVAVDGAFHHMDVIVFDTEIQISEPKHNAAGKRRNTFQGEGGHVIICILTKLFLTSCNCFTKEMIVNKIALNYNLIIQFVCPG